MSVSHYIVYEEPLPGGEQAWRRGLVVHGLEFSFHPQVPGEPDLDPCLGRTEPDQRGLRDTDGQLWRFTPETVPDEVDEDEEPDERFEPGTWVYFSPAKPPPGADAAERWCEMLELPDKPPADEPSRLRALYRRPCLATSTHSRSSEWCVDIIERLSCLLGGTWILNGEIQKTQPRTANAPTSFEEVQRRLEEFWRKLGVD